MSNPKIYVATHKATPIINDTGYFKIHAGKVNSSEIFDAIGDDTGDSISILNKSFSEMTAAYWLWKNSKEDIIGLCHYRRFFIPRKKKIAYEHIEIASSTDFEELNEGIDLIVPSPTPLGVNQQFTTAAQHYQLLHYSKDWYLLKENIRQHHNDYMNAFCYQENSYQLSLCNMFVAKKQVIDEYFSWLFDILLSLEKQISYKYYNDYQGRIFGFMSERLFNVWLLKNANKFKFSYRDIITL